MEELVADAYKLTDPAKKTYGFVANGQKGPAVAQDWMQYNAEMGGSILTSAGKPALNSEANIKSLTVYRDLFQKAAPPGAADYDWGGREESFRQGLSANMQTWSVGAPGYYDPKISKIVGKVDIKAAPRGEGLPKIYGIGGWGLAINADDSAKQKEAAWTFIKWIDSKKVHKELNLMGAGSFLRKSEMTDADLAAKFPFLPVVAEIVRAWRRRLSAAHPRISEDPGYSRNGGELGAGRQHGSEGGARRRAGRGGEAVLRRAFKASIVIASAAKQSRARAVQLGDKHGHARRAVRG